MVVVVRIADCKLQFAKACLAICNTPYAIRIHREQPW